MTLYDERYFPKIFQTLDSSAQAPEDRAAIAVKALEFLKISEIKDGDLILDSFNDAKKLIDAVESAKERDYLRRILLEAAQSVFSDAALEPAFDELLDQNIDAAGLTGFISTLKDMINKNQKKFYDAKKSLKTTI